MRGGHAVDTTLRKRAWTPIVHLPLLDHIPVPVCLDYLCTLNKSCSLHANCAVTSGSVTHALRCTCGLAGLLCRMVEVMVAVLSDPRVKAPDAAGAALGTLRSVLSVPDHVRAVERTPVCRPLVAALLAAYDGRLWVHSTDVLVRFWSGCGFAFSPCATVMESEDPVDLQCASSDARRQFGAVCAASPSEANKFLNNLINNVRKSTFS